MDYRQKLRIEPGSKVRLGDIDPTYRGDGLSKGDALAETARLLDDIRALQYLLYAEQHHCLLIVLQGIDAAGKDGVCRHVIRAMNPQGCSVFGFKQPSTLERRHDFLWRVHLRAPARGQVSVFNRSHYEDVLIVRVHGLVPEDVWRPRYDQINDFESLLAANGTKILKFFLYISKDEQLERFERRLDDESRHWKISESDYSERLLWDDYITAYEEMLHRCSTEHAPWYVIPANYKWFRNLAISHIIKGAMVDLDLQLPKPSVDIADIREKYHAARARQQWEDKSRD
ncbi:MAG: polyphosphate kinase 2 family protein [Pseudomonadota bacterium]